MSHTQLTQDERSQIYALWQQDFTMSKIAETIGYHKSTISREIKRNSGLRGYRPKQAQNLTNCRRKQAKKNIRLTDQIIKIIKTKLKVKWSPEQISGWMKDHKMETVSHECIYQYVAWDRKFGGELYKDLRQGKRKRRKKYGTGKSARGQLKNRVSIDKRPAEVELKDTIGHWEGDTIIGLNHKGAIVTLVERKSNLLRMMLVPNRKAETVHKATVKILKDIKENIHTITFDNGKEFGDHEKMASDLDTKIYFADPYCSWQRGLNENTNGLIRQYFPKKTDFTKLTQKQVAKIEREINERPRKLLSFKSPFEIFEIAA